jgi:Spy/CpxP family protein refolding chaperone
MSTGALSFAQGPGGFGGQRGGPPFGQRKPPTEAEKEAARLRMGISKEQQAGIEAIFSDADGQVKEIFTKLREQQRQLHAIYEQYDFDRNAALALRKQVNATYRRIGQMHAENEEKLRKILNREQFDKMQAMLREQKEQFKREFEKRNPPPGSGHP